jgi:hypothetical protein
MIEIILDGRRRVIIRVLRLVRAGKAQARHLRRVK